MDKKYSLIIPEIVADVLKEKDILYKDVQSIINIRDAIVDKQLEISLLKAEIIKKFRDVLRNDGLIADKLEDLESNSGETFEITKRYFYKSAKAGEGIKREEAYFCGDLRRGNPLCGWVKGEPEKEDYNNIGILCGTAGTIYRCRVCGEIVGERVSMMS